MPRVVSGKAGGINLDAPKGLKTRPTADKVKEAVFSIISFQIHGSRFLDAFAGTGQIGIEALSRGADSVVFIDQSKESASFIKQNLKKTRLEENAIVMMEDVSSSILKLKGTKPFDIVYMDPPFDGAISTFKSVVKLLLQYKILSENAVVILEHRSEDAPCEFVMNLKLKKSCKYGTIMVSFYDVANLYLTDHEAVATYSK